MKKNKKDYKFIAERTINMLEEEDKSFDYCVQFMADMHNCDYNKLLENVLRLLE